MDTHTITGSGDRRWCITVRAGAADAAAALGWTAGICLAIADTLHPGPPLTVWAILATALAATLTVAGIIARRVETAVNTLVADVFTTGVHLGEQRTPQLAVVTDLRDSATLTT